MKNKNKFSFSLSRSPSPSRSDSPSRSLSPSPSVSPSATADFEYYYNDKVLIEKHWYGNKYVNNFVGVEVVGRRTSNPDSREFRTELVLIRLPDGDMCEILESELFTNLK